MGKKSIAAETCRRLAEHYRGLVEAADILESSEVSESYLDGLKKEIESTKIETDKAKQALAAMREELKKVHEAGVKEIRDTDLRATQIIADGKMEAARLLKEAQDNALVAIETERRSKETALTRLQEQSAALTTQLTELQTRTREALQAEREATEKAKAAAEALAAIQSQAQKMAQKMATLSGG